MAKYKKIAKKKLYLTNYLNIVNWSLMKFIWHHLDMIFS